MKDINKDASLFFKKCSLAFAATSALDVQVWA